MRKKYFLLFIFLLLLSCASSKLEKSLSPEHKEFLSKVRYIITSEERKVFLNLPPSARDKFIEEFWKKRDPTPETEFNEFKEQYYLLIDEANKLFKGESQGWLSERGRVYILLGPPGEREVYPEGIKLKGKPTEIWRYGRISIFFIDYYRNGSYQLEPESARRVEEMIADRLAGKQTAAKPENVVFDFGLKIEKTKENEALIQIEVPYKDIWLKEEDNQFKTTLEVMVEISDSSGKKVKEIQKSYSLALEREKLKDFFGKSYLIEIPVSLEHGTYTLTVELENKPEQSHVKKKGNIII
jgi:GWxTD domain-containing protein